MNNNIIKNKGRKRKNKNKNKNKNIINKNAAYMRTTSSNPATLTTYLMRHMASFKSNQSQVQDNLKYISSIINPWDIVDAKRPSMCDVDTAMAHIRQTTIITANSLGNLFVFFDPQFISLNNANTTFTYCNAAGLTNLSPVILATLFTAGGTSTTPTGGVNMDRFRLNSAAIRASVKVSALNIVGSLVVAHTNVNTAVNGTGATFTNGLYDQLTTSANLLLYKNAKKMDIGVGDYCFESNWHPGDPSDAIFVTPNYELVDSGNFEVGSAPKIVMMFYGLPANANVEFEFVWNFEYVPIFGISSLVPTDSRAVSTISDLAAQDFISQNRSSLVAVNDISRNNLLQAIAKSSYVEDFKKTTLPSLLKQGLSSAADLIPGVKVAKSLTSAFKPDKFSYFAPGY